MSANGFEFKRNFAVHVVPHVTSVEVIAGWRVSIPKHDAIRYVKEWDGPNVDGFVQQTDGYVLVHGDARLPLDDFEAQGICDVIRRHYDVP